MDNDGASPCRVNLCDNETTEQPRRSTGGSQEKADNPERAARRWLTTRPRAPCSIALLPYVHMGDCGVTIMRRSRRHFTFLALIWDLDIQVLVALPSEADESVDSKKVWVFICKLNKNTGVILSCSSFNSLCVWILFPPIILQYVPYEIRFSLMSYQLSALASEDNVNKTAPMFVEDYILVVTISSCGCQVISRKQIITLWVLIWKHSTVK